MTIYDASPASADAFILGGGPVWCVLYNRVLWLDVNQGEAVESIRRRRLRPVHCPAFVRRYEG